MEISVKSGTNKYLFDKVTWLKCLVLTFSIGRGSQWTYAVQEWKVIKCSGFFVKGMFRMYLDSLKNMIKPFFNN
jgi:hypothetical protein